MDIINRYSNVFNSIFEVMCLYNINCRLTVLIDGSWIIVDFESKVFYYGSDPLEHFYG